MNRLNWIKKCNQWKAQWPVYQQHYAPTPEDTSLDLYAVLNAVNQYSRSQDIIMGDAGSISYAGPVALHAKPAQRFIFSPAQADMGWALPAAIGVALVSNQQVITITGDGSFMSNIQELAVIKQHDLNIKILILNNNGYLSIKNTQNKYFDGRIHGTDTESGLWFPRFDKIAETFCMEYHVVMNTDISKFQVLFAKTGPMIIECICKKDQEILPTQALRDGKQCGLHDMYPFLTREELQREMFYNL